MRIHGSVATRTDLLLITVAAAVAQYGQLETTRARQSILQSLATPDFRDVTGDFLDRWQAGAGRVGAEAVAVALITAAKSEHDHRREETVEIVWTGPEATEARFRQTEQAILEVVDSATKRLTVVRYAVYRIPRIREALVAAGNRGVGIRLIVETPDRLDGQGELVGRFCPNLRSCRWSCNLYYPRVRQTSYASSVY